MENLPGYRALDKARRVLGLPEIATSEQVKSAYRKLVIQYHPDKCDDKDKSLCTKKMVDINLIMSVETGFTQCRYPRASPWNSASSLDFVL